MMELMSGVDEDHSHFLQEALSLLNKG